MMMMMNLNSLEIFQNNINGFYSKSNLLEQNLINRQPHVCLLQEGFRSKNHKKDLDHNFQYLYINHWSETGRAGILCRRDIHSIRKNLSTQQNQFEINGYESCWVQISIPSQSQPILFCSFYRNISKQSVSYSRSCDFNEEEQLSELQNFKLDEFEKEIHQAY